jgi:hypothetical protein
MFEASTEQAGSLYRAHFAQRDDPAADTRTN